MPTVLQGCAFPSDTQASFIAALFSTNQCCVTFPFHTFGFNCIHMDVARKEVTVQGITVVDPQPSAVHHKLA